MSSLPARYRSTYYPIPNLNSSGSESRCRGTALPSAPGWRLSPGMPHLAMPARNSSTAVRRRRRVLRSCCCSWRAGQRRGERHASVRRGGLLQNRLRRQGHMAQDLARRGASASHPPVLHWANDAVGGSGAVPIGQCVPNLPVARTAVAVLPLGWLAACPTAGPRIAGANVRASPLPSLVGLPSEGPGVSGAGAPSTPRSAL